MTDNEKYLVKLGTAMAVFIVSCIIIGVLVGCTNMKSRTHNMVCIFFCAVRDTEISTEVAKRDAQVEIARERRKAAEAEVEAEAKVGQPIVVTLPPNPIPEDPVVPDSPAPSEAAGEK